MNYIKNANNAWQAHFQKERLRLLSSFSPFLVDFLQKGEITDLFYDDPEDMWSSWDICIKYNDNFYEFTFRVSEDYFYQQNDDFIDETDVDNLGSFLKDMDIVLFLREGKIEVYEEKLQKIFALHKGEKIEDIKKDDKQCNNFIYTLSNGEKFIINAWSLK